MVKRIGAGLIWMFLAAAMCSAQSTIYFPHVVNGLQGGVVWDTALIVTNPAAAGSAVASGTITLITDNGSAFNIAGKYLNAVTGQPAGAGNTISFQIAGGQTRFFIIDESAPPGPILSGFAKLTSTLPVVATSLFTETNAATKVGIASGGAQGAAALARQSAVAVKVHEGGISDNDVGIAYANPSAGTATVTFQLLDTNGVAFGLPKTRTLAGNNHTALFISELFPTLPDVFLGTMQISTDASTPLIATTLLFAGALFATLPMIPLP